MKSELNCLSNKLLIMKMAEEVPKKKVVKQQKKNYRMARNIETR